MWTCRGLSGSRWWPGRVMGEGGGERRPQEELGLVVGMAGSRIRGEATPCVWRRWNQLAGGATGCAESIEGHQAAGQFLEACGKAPQLAAQEGGRPVDMLGGITFCGVPGARQGHRRAGHLGREQDWLGQSWEQ